MPARREFVRRISRQIPLPESLPAAACSPTVHRALCMWYRTVGSYRVAALAAFALSITLCTCTIFYLVVLTEPVRDDFCRASFAVPKIFFPSPGVINYTILQIPGVINSTIFLYSNWFGRWLSIGLEALLLSTFPLPGAYPWLVFVLIVTQCVLLYISIWNFGKDARLAFFLSALIAFVYWANMPNTTQGIFWITGAIENQLPLTLVTFLFSLVLSHDSTGTRRLMQLPTIAASCLGFIIPAFHELLGGALVLALSAIVVSALVSKSPAGKTWITVWGASVIGSLVVFGAPGNHVRMAFEAGGGTYFLVIKGLLRTTRYYILPWCLDFKHWLLAIVLWFDPGVASVRTKFSGMSSFRAIGGFALVWLSSVMMMVGATICFLGFSPPPGRTMDLIYGVFLMGWIALAFLLTRPHPRFSFHPAYRVITLSSALFLLSLLVVTSNNTVTNLLDIISGRAQSWHAEMNRRSAVLTAASKSSDVILPPISSHPISISSPDWLPSDLLEDPNFWVNRCLSLYFGVASVRMSDSPKPAEPEPKR
jgi:hypothetical protein